jgi:sugar O-acyltransferase (sialic acid O-acetyltransferase NeuD family)
MKKEKLIIIGASGHAKVIIDIVEKQDKFELLGLIESNPNLEKKVLGYGILGDESILSETMYSYVYLFIAIGDNWVRHLVKERISALHPTLKFATLIHPTAQIAKGVKIGEGVCIMAGAIVNSDSIIDNFTIINTKASMDHDGYLGAFASLAPNATTGGNVSIGDFTSVGISATIKHGVQIGKHGVIGGGALVLNNFEDNQVIYGVPAKAIRSRILGEKYL